MPLILIPAIITFAVTLLRLVGELLNLSPALFSRASGGGFSLVGISWLIPVFGVYFASKLCSRGLGPSSGWAAAGWALLGLVVLMALGAVANLLKWPFGATFLTIAIGSWVAIAIAFRGWPALAKTLLGYGLAARIPVALVMLVAIYGRWGTHYDVPPAGQPQFETMAPIVKWFWIGVVPQMTIWLFMTVIFGMLCGGVFAALSSRRPAAS